VASSLEEDAPEGEALPRDVKMAVGTAIHRALERLDLDLPPEEALAAERARLAADLALLLPPERLPAAESSATGLWRTFGESPLAARLYELAPHLLARELPVLLPPQDGAEAPAGFSAGAVDLLYLDPRTGEPVVADFKTDEVAGDDELADRARVYAPQGRAYARAVAQALGLDRTPRFELWFLRAGRIEIGG
jgi:ATP-dependent exoDNAse (exonuclease V) beta subunit